jgi:hypothetical protein
VAVGRMKRKVSWVLGSLAYVAPPTWAYFEQASVYQGNGNEYGYVCGLPMLAIILLASIASGALSLVSFSFCLASFHSLPKPRQLSRKAELALLVAPAILAVCVLCALLAF